MNGSEPIRSMWILLELFSLLGCIALIVPELARANTLNVTSSTEFSILANCSLREAIANHNARGTVGFNLCLDGSKDDVITFDADITDVFVDSPLPAIAGILRINPDHPVTIHSGYFTINNGATLTWNALSDVITGIDFRTNQSMFVNNGGTLVISGGTFSNNGAPRGLPDSGGVIFNRGGAVSVSGSVFTSNGSIERGGAIYNNAALTIKGATFVGNSALPEGIGGAIYNDRLGSMRIVDGSAKNLIAENAAAYGGAIYNNHGTVQIVSNNFSISDNSAGFNGGGIYTTGGGLTITRGIGPVVTDIAIASIVAGDTGGGIYDRQGHLSLSGIEIKGNTANDNGGTAVSGNGGGLVVDHDNASITQTYLHNNVATSNGGGIYDTNGTTLSITASTFAHDIAAGSDNQLGGGAAILNDGGSQLAITNSTFVGTLPGQDPESIEVDSGSAKITSVTIAGSDIASATGALTLRNSILSDVHCFFSGSTGNDLQFGDVTQCPGVVADPAFDLNGLQFNGGPTPTLAIVHSSAAINEIPLNQCVGPDGRPLRTDQRGFTRPASNQQACDIGAFEFGAVPSRVSSVDGAQAGRSDGK